MWHDQIYTWKRTFWLQCGKWIQFANTTGGRDTGWRLLERFQPEQLVPQTKGYQWKCKRNGVMWVIFRRQTWHNLVMDSMWEIRNRREQKFDDTSFPGLNRWVDSSATFPEGARRVEYANQDYNLPLILPHSIFLWHNSTAWNSFWGYNMQVVTI